jgi:CDP-glycerol glycerophosphotransferase
MASRISSIRVLLGTRGSVWATRIISYLWAFVPSVPLAIVAGPPFEGNAIETLRWLSRNYPGRVVWLVDGEPDFTAAAWLLSDGGHQSRVEIKAKSALACLSMFLRAQLVFFTDTLYGAPRPRGRRFVVNLWHGDGPKTVATGLPEDGLQSSMLISGTRVWGLAKARTFGVAAESVLVCGNPRIDQFLRPAEDQAIEALGLDPSKPIVLWAPTFRVGQAKGQRWVDSGAPFAFAQLSDSASELGALTSDAGLQLVVKPHPLDTAQFDLPGVVTMTDSQLSRARITLYQLMARTSALVTDYSSIWTDYLSLGRPVGFYCPDLEDYAFTRGLMLDEFALGIPGPLLADATDLVYFLRCVLEGQDVDAAKRRDVALSLGVVTSTGATDRMMSGIKRRFAINTEPAARCERF